MNKYLYILVWIWCILFYGNANSSIATDGMVKKYIDKLYTSLINNKIDSVKFYLDSISLSYKEIKDPLLLGYYYYGTYYNLKQNETEAHRYYYKAIEYLQKTKNQTLTMVIYHNLAISYIQKKDIEHLEVIIDKMNLICSNKDVSNQILNYRILSFYYECLHEKKRDQSTFLDSAIYYNKQVISLFEISENIPLRKEEIAYNYLHIVCNLLKKGEFDLDTLSHYLNRSDDLMAKDDTVMINNRLWVTAEILFYKNDYEKAKKAFMEQIIFMETAFPEKELSIYVDVCDRLIEIAQIQSDYKSAVYYQQKKMDCLSQIHDTQKYEIIRELETKYEVKQKEQAIIHLTESNVFRQKINNLYLFLLLIGIMAFLFVFRWFRQKKKTMLTQLELTRVEKDNAVLLIQLKEKELNETVSQKCIALVDNYFKDKQIADMDLELQQLQLAYEQQKQENKKPEKIGFATEDSIYKQIVQDVYGLIDNRMETEENCKNEYLDKLRRVTDRFFEALKENVPGELSYLNIKYYVCFYIGMKNEHIAHCLSVQTTTVRVYKCRLKTRLRRGKDMDINILLKLMNDKDV